MLPYPKSVSMKKAVNVVVVVSVFLYFSSVGIAGTGILNDYNPYNYDIPDNGGSVNSDLALSGAPSGATITNVKIYYEIRHTYIGDLKVWLTTYYNGAWHDFILKNREGGSADNIIETRDNLTTWNGASPNQTWYLVSQDMATGNTGYIDFFELWVTYSVNDPPNTPSSEDPSDGETGVSVNADLDWYCSDLNNDSLYYTVYFEKNDSSPDVAIKTDQTGSSASLATLDYSSHYYWRVMADDHKGGVTWSPVWDFYTEAEPVIAATITIQPIAAVIQGNTLSVDCQVRNDGNVTRTFGVGAEIKDGSSVLADLGQRTTSSIGPGSHTTVNFTYAIPQDWTAKEYTLHAVVWSGTPGSSDWLDDDNETFSVLAQSIDASITVNAITTVEAGQAVSIPYTVTNDGNVSYAFGVGAEIWKDGVKQADAGSQTTPTLSPGAATSASFSYDIPTGWLGNYVARCAVWTGTPGASTWLDSHDRSFTVLEPPIGAEITGVSFSPTTSSRGIDVITATVSVRNTGAVASTFYFGASSILSGGSSWSDWSPSRTKFVLDAGATANVLVTWLPPSGAESGTYGFYSKVFKEFSGTDFYDENWIDTAFQVTVPVSFTSVSAAEIIVRAGDSLNLGSQTDVQALIDQCLAIGVPAISLMTKHDETGELLYPSTLPYTACYNGYPASYITSFIDIAHQNGIKVYAWVPMFKDMVLYNASSDFQMRVRDFPASTTSPSSESRVSPANPAVTNHLLQILHEVMSSFAFDGIRTDFGRYGSNWEDMHPLARTSFSDAFGVDPLSLSGFDDPHWIDWIDWRADLISGFITSVQNLVAGAWPSASIGTYIFPNTARPGGYRDYVVYWAPTCHSSTWSGQRYEDYGVLGRGITANPMPMVYWQTDTTSSTQAVTYIDEALRYARQLSVPNEVIPVFSVGEGTPEWPNTQLSESEILQHMALVGGLCQDNGVRRISYFYYGEWQPNHFARIRASYQGPVGAVTPGRHDFDTVPVGQASQCTFTVQNVGTESLTVTPSCDSPFSVVSPAGSIVLAGGQSAQVKIAYSPTVQGAVEQKVRFQTADGTIERTVLGTGTPPSNAPTDIALSNATVPEHQPSGTTVGTLSTTDPDSGDSFTYELVPGVGSADNGSFTITGDQLQTAAMFDYDMKNSYSIRIRTTDQAALWYEEAFTITVTSSGTFYIDSIIPNSGPSNGGTEVTVYGANFVEGDDAYVEIGGKIVLGGSFWGYITYASDGSWLRFDTPAHAAGAVDVIVHNPDGQEATLTDGYTYTADPAPTITSISPTSGGSNGGTEVTVYGANFVKGTDFLAWDSSYVSIGGNKVYVSSITYASDGSWLRFDTPAHAAGAVDVIVHNPDGQEATLTDGYTYTADPAPTITSISPTSGGSNGGTEVTVYGANFVEGNPLEGSGGSVTIGGIGLPALFYITYAPDGSWLRFDTPVHAAGTVDVTVHNPDGQEDTLTDGYTYTADPAPSIASISPTSGPNDGGTEVTVHGANFVDAANSGVTIGGIGLYPFFDITYAPDGSWLRFETPAHATGTVDVTVHNPDGQEDTLTDGYTYEPTLYVCSDGNCGDKPNCYTSIESAVEAAESGSFIKVANNITYNGDVTVSGKTLTIQGGWDTTFDNQSGTTTIQGAPTVSSGSLTIQQVNIVP